ncbi:MAG: redoxin domain-containing protein [Syntrophaceae bacterium]|nr:redoxin domain-containing protein [Syntrophaceae bacterium]
MRTPKLFFIVLLFFVLWACASTGSKSSSHITGQNADDFTLSDQNGKLWKLSNVLKNNRAVVLAFYPKDDTKL